VGTDSTPRSFLCVPYSNIADNFSVVYSKRALQPVFQEIMDAAYDPQVQEYVIKNEFNVTFDELQPLISPRIAQTLEQYQGKIYKGYDVENS